MHEFFGSDHSMTHVVVGSCQGETRTSEQRLSAGEEREPEERLCGMDTSGARLLTEDDGGPHGGNTGRTRPG
jgi:hypothetical protein